MTIDLRGALTRGEQAGQAFQLAVPRRLPLGAVGTQQGARSGSSLEFQDHREYEPGDDLRHIDWNAFGRSDQLMVKLFHEEVTPHLDLLLDGSRSMALDGSVKAESATGLAGFFAAAAANAGMSHRVWTAGAGCDRLEGSQSRSAGWQLPTFDFTGNMPDSFSRRPPVFRPRGLRIVISDLFWVGDPIQILGPCVDRATLVLVIQVLSRMDVTPPERGNLRLVDSETGEMLELLVDDAALSRYQAKLDRHQKNWFDACRRAGAMLTRVVAEDFLAGGRFDDLLAMNVLQAI